MYIKPIPLSTLIHTVEYEEIKPTTRYGTTYEPPITIERVLVQYGTKIMRKTLSNGTTEDRQVKAVLFIDAFHSTPFQLMKENSRIKFDGQEFIVDFVERCYAFELHHYEVALV